ncbi:MAG: amidohydrolase family protein [Chloroflexi bacterium]|nr:amidohydrolase family protein [Chloroflexota bacterium]MCL5111052.1 amidohydrolase family protein [Chloroflexota bacterium]
MAPIFDTHVHIYDRSLYPFRPGFARPDGERADAATLVGEMDAAGVDAALLVQTPWYGEDNRYLLESMRRFPGRFAAIGYLVDPLAPDAPVRLERQYHEDGFRGVRFHLADDLRGFVDDQRIIEGLLAGAADPLLRQARELGVPVQFLNRVSNQHAIVAVADRHPDLTIVVDHLGHPLVAEAPNFPSSCHLFALAERPNVYVKMSNQVLSSRQPYPWRDLHDYQKRLVDLFGPRRLMWGTNWPLDTPQLTYAARLAAVRDELPFLSEEDKIQILGRTAFSLWQPV